MVRDADVMDADDASDVDDDAATVVAAHSEMPGMPDADPELWEHVEPCATRDASKAVDIRSALTAKLGKARAVQLLSKTRATVAKDAQGHNNRVLRANGTLLKLRA
jgi:hypothetical protein